MRHLFANYLEAAYYDTDGLLSTRYEQVRVGSGRVRLRGRRLHVHVRHQVSASASQLHCVLFVGYPRNPLTVGTSSLFY
jgi:hypothetical protein